MYANALLPKSAAPRGTSEPNLLTCSLQSGSNGNCIYVEAGGKRLLFDAGISGRQARDRLASHRRQMRDVDAVLLSHDHMDHVRCAGVFQRLFGLPLYATPGTHRMMLPRVGKVRDVRTFSPGETLTFGPVRVFTYPTPHDAAEGVVFVVEHDGRRLGIFTDLGHPFAGLDALLDSCDAAYLESNYDPDMLAGGPYPWVVQERIRSATGHLSNEEAAELVRSRRQPAQWIALAHLSEHNNSRAVALETHQRVCGDGVRHVAERVGVSALWAVA